ncbi:MAG: hypothetical protein NTW19_15230 [Planctomycetota bacterium]|nr:hypothetical protein [Planctomycetota bacterium]
MKELLQKHPWIVPALAAVILLFAAWGILRTANPPVKVELWPKAYYYDLKAGTTFVSTIDRVPPVPTPGGDLPDGQPVGVWAAVFSCGSCDDAPSRFVGWLEKFTPETQKQLAALIEPRKEGFKDFNPYETRNLWDTKGHVMATKDALDRWVPMEDPEAEEIQLEVAKHCAAPAKPTRCSP